MYYYFYSETEDLKSEMTVLKKLKLISGKCSMFVVDNRFTGVILISDRRKKNGFEQYIRRCVKKNRKFFSDLNF